MIRLSLLCLALIIGQLTIFNATAFAEEAPSAAPIDFSRDIRPILSDRCFHCHGPDESNRKGGFRLDQEKSAFGAADSGDHPIVPGKPEKSELIKRITTKNTDEQMPPPKSGKTLAPKEIELLQRWIREGAKWQDHWAFVAPAPKPLPQVKDAKWGRRDLDRWTLANLEARGLKPSPEADRETLIRRVSFHLTGLPPTPQEIDDFVSDKSAQAYEKVVDRLLASPRYGEHMAVQWLDGARYADTNGYQNDFARMMWPWRDWVIKAYNDNMPYKQFVIEQLAGDLLPNSTNEQKVATGFLRNNRSVTEAGSVEAEWHLENLVDRVETTSMMFLGLTMGCARCHDHKYDPIRQREFYEFLGFFNGSKDRGFYSEVSGNTGPLVKVLRPEDQQRLAELDAAIAKAEQEAAAQIANNKTVGFVAWTDNLQKQATEPEPEAKLQLPLDGDLMMKVGKSVPTDIAADAATFGKEKPQWGDALLGKSLQLSGKPDSYVNLAEAMEFSRESKFSISCWVRPNGRGTAALWSKMDDSAGYRGFDTLVLDDGRVEVHLIHQARSNKIKVTSVQKKLRLGHWNHICVTYDGSSEAEGLKLYFDGNQVPLEINSDSLTETIATTQPFRLGKRSNSLFYKGELSDLRVYDQALSDAEVRQVAEEVLIRSARLAKTAVHAEKSLKAYYDSVNAAPEKQHPEVKRLRTEKEALTKAAIPTVMVMEEMPKPRPTYVFKRGQYDAPDKSETLQPGVPGFLPSLPPGAEQNRLSLARWLTDPANPLVARVEANRIWQQFFGQGLVTTPENFGFQGDPPSHQQLLDFLALEFVRLNWDVKALQKEIVLSATYRQSSAIPQELTARDPDNRLLARGPRFRFSAEEIRDNALAVGGLLAAKVGGPSVKPYQPDGLWAELAGGRGEGPYKQDSGENLHRRSLYTYRKRTVPHPTTSTFDAPAWETCTSKRSRTNTPLQSLALLNDQTYVEAGRGLGQRMMLEGGDTAEERLVYGFRLVTGRKPASQELSLLLSAYQRYGEQFGKDPAAAKKYLAVGEFRANEKLDPSQLAAYATVGCILLNLDETITNH